MYTNATKKALADRKCFFSIIPLKIGLKRIQICQGENSLQKLLADSFKICGRVTCITFEIS